MQGALPLPPLVHAHSLHPCSQRSAAPTPSNSCEQVQSVAQLGVHLLLFTLGLEFSLTKLRAVRNVALFGGLLQVRAAAGRPARGAGRAAHAAVLVARWELGGGAAATAACLNVGAWPCSGCSARVTNCHTPRPVVPADRTVCCAGGARGQADWHRRCAGGAHGQQARATFGQAADWPGVASSMPRCRAALAFAAAAAGHIPWPATLWASLAAFPG